MSSESIRYCLVGLLAYLLQASIMAPNYGQFNHWMLSSAMRGIQMLPSLGRQQQQAINEWSARKWGDIEDVPVEACQTAPNAAKKITLEQYSALKALENPQYGDVQSILGDENIACTTITGAHRYLAAWRPEALDITYPPANGFTAQIRWSNPGDQPPAAPDTGAGDGLATNQ